MVLYMMVSKSPMFLVSLGGIGLITENLGEAMLHTSIGKEMERVEAFEGGEIGN